MNKDYRNEKGITLIALVITIIVLLILAGIALVALSGQNGILNRASKSKEYTDIGDIKEQIQIKIMEKQALNEGKISEESLKNILETYGTLSLEEEKLIDKILTTAKGNYKIKVSDIWNGIAQKEAFVDKSGANEPNVSKIAQKTYVTWKINEEGTQYIINDTQTTQPDNWYNYENGQWANIKTTNVEEELEAYWVWIPRYEYIVPTSTTAQQIEVRFIGIDKKEGTNGYTKQSDGTIKSNDGYTIHPAFTNEGNGGFGELDGIWVAKFESVSNEPTLSNGGGNNTNLKVQVAPDNPSWRGIETKNIFSVCRKMTNEDEVLAGSTVDSHMMKNTEWGAVVILSQSKYGIYNTQSSIGENGDNKYQVWNNPKGHQVNQAGEQKNIYIGYTGDIADASTDYSSTTYTTNVYAYDSKNGTKGSTTGTVYGIYDMAGGSWEYVAGCLNGQENAKFGVEVGKTKYVDLYINLSNVATNYEGAKIGDATKEIKGWNSDDSNFVNSSYPVFLRGRYLL